MIVTKDPQGREFTAFPDALGNLCRLRQAEAGSLGPLALVGLGRVGSEMILTREDVEALLPHLHSWLTTGSLSPGEDKSPA